METTKRRETPLWAAILPCALLILLLIVNVSIFRDDSSSGPNQLALLLSAVFAGAIGHFMLKMDYREIETRAIRSIVLAMEALIILLIVGCLIGLWIISGVVPAMVYYGIQTLSPSVFLLAACLICSIVSLAIGSSWSTMGTVGVALIGIGQALGFPLPLVAGAIISGAYFGDKMSPLSDTTNLAPAVAGTNLFTHIRHMFYTTIPAYTLTLLIFMLIGFFYTPGEYSGDFVGNLLETIENSFNIGWYLLLIPLVVIALAARRVPAIPTLVTGAVLGCITAIIFQPQQFADAESEASFLTDCYRTLPMVAYNGFEMNSGNEIVDNLFSRGGMVNMFSTVSLIISAMLFGGIMEATGMLPRIARAILSRVRGAGSLIGATIGSSILFNIFAAEQYIAIVIPGRMYRQAYKDYDLAPRNLSRALEDGGTVTSVLVPWNTCGAFASGILAVPTLSYLPFCFFNLLCPLVSVSMAAMHLAIVKASGETGDGPVSQDVQPEI
jgi:Na+:H+ antiporter, NhaC family